MAEAQLQQFREKVRQLHAFLALCDSDPALLASLRDCDHHDQVVALARRCGFEIGRRWGEAAATADPHAEGSLSDDPAPPSPGESKIAGQPPAAAGGDRQCEPPLVAAPWSAPSNQGHDPSAPVASPGPATSAAAPLSCSPATSPPPAVPPSTADRLQAATVALGAMVASGAPAVDTSFVCAEAMASAGAIVSAGATVQRFAASCPPPGQELTEVLLHTPQLRLERIHSCSAVSPDGFWYEQAEHEWVLVLQGSARLRLDAELEDRQLHQGDSLYIPAGCRHRVSATDPHPGTIWLALFWRDH